MLKTLLRLCCLSMNTHAGLTATCSVLCRVTEDTGKAEVTSELTPSSEGLDCYQLYAVWGVGREPQLPLDTQALTCMVAGEEVMVGSVARVGRVGEVARAGVEARG
jgi:hypothetical protein